MFFRRFVGLALVFVLLLGLFGLVGSSLYRSGWSEGFVAGQVTAGGEDGAVPVAPGYGHYAGPGVGFSPFFGFAGGFLKFLFIFLLFGFFFKMIGFWFWRKRGHAGKHWRWGHGHHGHRGRYGGAPPWYDDEGEEPVMKA
jgi:hypothetical protein